MNVSGDMANQTARDSDASKLVPGGDSAGASATAPPAYRGRVKYTPETARRYQVHTKRKDRAEMRLVERAFAYVPRGRVLDIPCGGGRMSLLLAQKGYAVMAADLSESMLGIARENLRNAGLVVGVERQDVEKLSYADKSFDSILSFRLFHHFPNVEIRQRAVRELCRVANRFVVVSYFSPYSFTSVKRRLRAAKGGRRSQKHSTSLAEVRGYFREAGFRLVKDFARLKLVHTLHLAVFERVDHTLDK